MERLQPVWPDHYCWRVASPRGANRSRTLDCWPTGTRSTARHRICCMWRPRAEPEAEAANGIGTVTGAADAGAVGKWWSSRRSRELCAGDWRPPTASSQSLLRRSFRAEPIPELCALYSTSIESTYVIIVAKQVEYVKKPYLFLRILTTRDATDPEPDPRNFYWIHTPDPKN